MGETPSPIPKQDSQELQNVSNELPPYIQKFVKTDDDEQALKRFANALNREQLKYSEGSYHHTPGEQITVGNFFEDKTSAENGISPMWETVFDEGGKYGGGSLQNTASFYADILDLPAGHSEKEYFINDIKGLSAFMKPQNASFVRKALEKGIPLDFWAFSSNALWGIRDDFNAEAEGLSMFRSVEDQVVFINVVTRDWGKNPEQIVKSSKYFNEALEEDTQGNPVSPEVYQAAMVTLKDYFGKMVAIHTEQGLHPNVIKSILGGISTRLTELMPNAAPILDESLKVYQQIQSHPLNEVISGHHPDLKNIPESKMSLEDRKRLSVALEQRDIFTPLCYDAAEKIEAAYPAEIKEVEKSLEWHPREAEYDEDRKKVWEKLNQQDKELGRRYFDLTRNFMEFNTSDEKRTGSTSLEPATGKFDEFVWAPSESDSNDIVVKFVVVPVGAYGKDFSRRLLETARTTMKLAEASSHSTAVDINSQNPNFVAEATARALVDPKMLNLKNPDNPTGYHIFSNEYNYPSSMSSLLEGIITITGTLSLLMAQKPDGFDDPDMLLAKIIDKSLINHFAGHVSGAVTMPKILAGRYYENPLSIVDGEPMLSKALIKTIEESKKQAKAELDTRAEEGFMGETNLGCPVGKRGHELEKSGIEALSEAFWHIYKSLYLLPEAA